MRKAKKNKQKRIINAIMHNGIEITMFLFVLLYMGLMITKPGLNLWLRIIIVLFAVSIIAVLLILGMPKSEKHFSFDEMTFLSFVTWCVFLPVIVGVFLIAIISQALLQIAVDELGMWLIAICIVLFSFFWFLQKLNNKKNRMSYLDLYSTIWISFLTILTTIFDFEEKKIILGFLLSTYLLIQILIKKKICQSEEERDIKESDKS